MYGSWERCRYNKMKLWRYALKNQRESKNRTALKILTQNDCIIVVFFQGNPLYMYQFTFLIYQIWCIFIDGGIYYILCIRLLNNNINHMLQIEKKSDYLICFEFWKDTFLYFCILRWSLKEPRRSIFANLSGNLHWSR